MLRRLRKMSQSPTVFLVRNSDWPDEWFALQKNGQRVRSTSGRARRSSAGPIPRCARPTRSFPSAPEEPGLPRQLCSLVRDCLKCGRLGLLDPVHHPPYLNAGLRYVPDAAHFGERDPVAIVPKEGDVAEVLPRLPVVTGDGRGERVPRTGTAQVVASTVVLHQRVLVPPQRPPLAETRPMILDDVLVNYDEELRGRPVRRRSSLTSSGWSGVFIGRFCVQCAFVGWNPTAS